MRLLVSRPRSSACASGWSRCRPFWSAAASISSFASWPSALGSRACSRSRCRTRPWSIASAAPWARRP